VKIEQVLVHYLLKNKILNLQGIGTFHLDAVVPDVSDPDKPITIPENAVSFHYDPKTKEDDGLVDFIVEYTHKIKPLAASDLESFLSLGLQFLNIGKPFTLHKLGTLDKLNSGELIFKAGELIAEKIEPQKIKNEETEQPNEEENLFNDYQQKRKSNTGAKVFYMLVILKVLALIGWAIWGFDFDKKNVDESTTSTEAIIPVTDSASHTDSARNTTDSTTDGLAAAVQQNPVDSSTFKIVVNEYRTLSAATKRLSDLKSYGRNVIMYTNDSVIYKIAEPFTLPLSDTTKMLDSLKGYYSNVYLDK
jgi:hypothetical protein